MRDITDIGPSRELSSVAKLLRMVFLLALRDGADRLTFEPGSDEMSMKYRVAGVWETLVPPPRHLADGIAQEIRRMAEQPDPSCPRRSWFRSLLRRTARRQVSAQAGWFTFRVKATVVNAWVKLFPVPDGHRVLVEMHRAGSVRAAAAASLREMMETPVRSGDDLADLEKLASATPGRKHLQIALLLAIRDGADAITFEPVCDRLAARYRIVGGWREMDPSLSRSNALLRHIREMIKTEGLALFPIPPSLRRILWLGRLLRRRKQLESREQDFFYFFRVKSHDVSARFVIPTSRDRVLLEFRTDGPAAEEAAAVLEAYGWKGFDA
jgi:hypothetical protein